MTPNSNLARAGRRLSVAPMMDWTDRWCRYFHRRLTKRALLYTEMVTADAILRGDRTRLLAYDASERPLALQLGGSEPHALAQCARLAEAAGFDEINLNVGCPSDRVQSGRFGACLMREPELVGDCVAAMAAAVAIPVTVKCRIGVDDQDPREALPALIDAVAAAGARAVIVHARKAWLQGLSPKDNREIPPLDYGLVHEMKRARPAPPLVVNGGIASLADARDHLIHVDGVMIGRAAYRNPWLLSEVDPALFDAPAPLATRAEAVEAMIPFIEQELARGTRLNQITRHMIGLYQGQPGARAWRRSLSVEAARPGAGVAVVREALGAVEAGGLNRRARPRYLTSASSDARGS